MPTANLTDRKVASLKARDPEERWDEKVPGFGIRVSAKGKKTWFVMYRYAGLRRRLKLGHYPDVDLEEARRKARNALKEVDDGNDPAQQKKDKLAEALRERLEAKTFAQLAAAYIEQYAKLNKKSWQEDVRILDKHLLPEFARLNVKEITRSHIRLYLRQVALTTRVHANRIHATIRKMFNWR
jgi:hypothetical protein